MGKVTIEVPIESGTLEMVRDAVLFSGEYWWMFYVCLVGFSFCNSRTILGAVPNINYFHGCAFMVLANYGGSTLAMIMMSKPVVFVVNEALVPVALICFTIAWLERNNRVVNKFLADTSIGAIFSSITYEIMRCHVAMGCSAAAAASLPSLLPGGSSSRVAIVGPLIAGVLGGCGGAFMPGHLNVAEADDYLASLAPGVAGRIEACLSGNPALAPVAALAKRNTCALCYSFVDAGEHLWPLRVYKDSGLCATSRLCEMGFALTTL